ncbi:MAG: GNAT family N-acetyltransferase [Solirubrobacterales bacterium]
MSHRNAHLNLVESSRQLFELDPGAEIEAGAGWLFCAGRSSHPVISNAAFRSDDDLDPGELLERAQAFFAARDRRFAVWARDGIEEDQGLIEAAEATGLQAVFEMPEMVLGGRVEDPELPNGVELRRVTSAADADAYWQVATDAYASNGFPPEIFAFYEKHDGLAADNAATFLAHLDGRPAAIAMTIVSHGVAGIYWVGTTAETRGRGLGSTMTATAVNAGFDIGGEIASLQASPMGESLYRRMGFETVFDYRLFMCPPPGEER